MDLVQQQRLLSSLYTNADVRRRFFEEPEKVAREFGLSANTAEVMAQLRADQVRRFAFSLHRKRMNEVAKLLPITRTRLETEFEPLFLSFVRSGAQYGGSKDITSDAIGFARFLEGAHETNRASRHWVAALARYEVAWLQAAHRACLVKWFAWPVQRISPAWPAEGLTPPLRLTIAFWIRYGHGGRLRHFTVSFFFGWAAGSRRLSGR